MTTCRSSPLITDPDLVTWDATIIAVYDGTVAGGGTLFPGFVDHGTPATGSAGESSNPLKLAGAGPPLSVFSCGQVSAQNVTDFPIAEPIGPTVASPSTNDPPWVYWKSRSVPVPDDGR